MNDRDNEGATFPERLLTWAGHREGGVKKPFHAGSGRPTGSAIVTPVVSRLRNWVDDIVESRRSTPTAVFLIGGPGNGKTDAVEVAIQYLDDRLRLGGKLFEAIAATYSPAPGQLAPRLVSVSLSKCGATIPAGMPPLIRLVQDATERDPLRPHASAVALLVEELGQMLSHSSDAIYICCANRGVISEAVNEAKQSASDQVLRLLNTILSAVTSGPRDVSCWPLQGYTHVAVWPMDIESLTEASVERESVSHQIFGVALDGNKWHAPCVAGKNCPVCLNRELLADSDALSALIRLLRYFELGSGKRWTFRDLFSLVAYSIVGTEKEYEGREGLMHPCQLSRKQIELASQTKEPVKSLRAKLDLMSRLYHHRLFPLWPTVRGDLYKANRELSRQSIRDLEPAKALFSWLTSRQRNAATELMGLIAGPWSDLLDPAVATGSREFVWSGRIAFSLQEIEEHFSLSVKDGLALVKRCLTSLELDVIKDLARADEALAGDDLPRAFIPYAIVLQRELRHICCRIVKRSICVRKGVAKDCEQFVAYHHATTAEDGLKDFRKQLQGMLHDEKNRFRSSLATTFGQPAPYRSRNVMLITSKVAVKAVPAQRSARRPAESIPYVRVNNHVIPINFELFAALREVGSGMRPSCLAGEIFALLDATHSVVTGQVVRDPDILADEVSIEIGGCCERIVLEDGQLSVQREEH